MAKKKTGLSSTLFQGIDPYGQQAVTIPDVDTVATYKLSNILPDLINLASYYRLIT